MGMDVTSVKTAQPMARPQAAQQAQSTEQPKDNLVVKIAQDTFTASYHTYTPEEKAAHEQENGFAPGHGSNGALLAGPSMVLGGGLAVLGVVAGSNNGRSLQAGLAGAVMGALLGGAITTLSYLSKKSD